MSRTAEWLKNLFHLFSHHDQPSGAIARVDKDPEKVGEGKERQSGGTGGNGGYKVVGQKTAPSPFSEGGAGGF